MLTKGLLLAFLLFTVVVNAQPDVFGVEPISRSSCCEFNYSTYIFKPANASEKNTVAKADSAMLSFLKTSKEPHWSNTVPYFVSYSESEKYLDQKPLAEHMLIAYWNETFDTLYGWALAPMFTATIGKTTGKSCMAYLPVYEYKNFMKPADYKAFQDLFIAKMKTYIGIKHDTLTGNDITAHKIKLDTTVLKHLDFSAFISRKVLDLLNEGSINGYTDLSFTTVITKEEVDMVRTKLDKLEDNRLSSIFIYNKWAFDNTSVSLQYPQNKYGYAFYATRQKIAIGLGNKTEPKGFVRYSDLQEAWRLAFRPEAISPFEQAVEEVFFKRCKIYCND